MAPPATKRRKLKHAKENGISQQRDLRDAHHPSDDIHDDVGDESDASVSEGSASADNGSDDEDHGHRRFTGMME